MHTEPNGVDPASDTLIDLLVIGGGVNGAGIAADAAGRGLSVLLCEKSDLASATSSASSKLIHGGLRYLESYQFRLVRESLAEREVLLKAAPHIVQPLRFRLPHHAQLRPLWMIRAGLFLYDHLSKRVSLPASRGIRLDDGVLLDQYQRGFEYSDCWVDDARLVILNAMQARKHGATVLTRTACIALRGVPASADSAAHWQVTLRDELSGESRQLRARCVVNATGPWVSRLGQQLSPAAGVRNLRLVKGSHIVVPRLHEHPQAYLLQNADGRVVFVTPFENDFSLIGTTEQEFRGDPDQAEISSEETDYLLDVTARYFRNAPAISDIRHQFAGVRPLIDDETANVSKASRDYVLDFASQPAPILTVYGGKITTYRRLAESALERLRPLFPQMKAGWTAEAVLPGGEFHSHAQLCAELAQSDPWLDATQAAAWVSRYGRLVHTLLDGVNSREELGELLGPGLYAREVQYLCSNEWARTADDILWRRTRLGLRFNGEQQRCLESWLQHFWCK